MNFETLTKDNYVMKFGKYKNMLIKDVAKITTIDKNGETKKVGLQYLQWITGQEWFKHQNIVKELIDDIVKEFGEDKEEKKIEKKSKKNKTLIE